MHRTWKLDVKEFLHSGENQIRIVFRSVFKYIEAYEYEDNKEIHYVPCGGMKGKPADPEGSLYVWMGLGPPDH